MDPEDYEDDEEERGGEEEQDVVWHQDGRLVAIDVAIVNADSDDAARRNASASRDGVTAAGAERRKMSRYVGLPITLFVLEGRGRPGEAAQGIVRSLAHHAGSNPAALWQAMSIRMQTALAWQFATGACHSSSVAGAGGLL